MQVWMDKKGCYQDPKAVLIIMKRYGLLSDILRRIQWKQLGRQIHRYKNLLNREFRAEGPNNKWCNDISSIQLK